MFVPLFHLDNVLATVDECSTSRDIHLDLIRTLRGQAQAFLTGNIGDQFRVCQQIFGRMAERIAEITDVKHFRNVQETISFTNATAYETLQPWFKESMKRKVEVVNETEEKTIDANVPMSRLPNASSLPENGQFFSYVGRLNSVTRQDCQR